MTVLLANDLLDRVAAPERDAGLPARVARDRLLELAAELDPSDRELVESVLGRGMTAAAIARMTGLARRRVQQRLRRLERRLTSPEFAFVLNHRHAWPAERRLVAERVFLAGHSQPRVSRETGFTLHRVRREATAVEILLEQARAMGRLR